MAKKRLVAKLAGAGFIEEVEASGALPVWRSDDMGAFALRVTDIGLAAIEVDEPDTANKPEITEIGGHKSPQTRKLAKEPKDRKSPSKHRVCGSKQKRPRNQTGHRAGTKIAQVTSMLSRKNGATIAEMMGATGWLAHTTRAVLTGLRKHGYQVERESVKDGKTIYRIVSAPTVKKVAGRHPKTV